MRKRFKSFMNDERGAVSVDWVVLTAGVVALAASIFLAMENGAMSLTNDVTTFMDNRDPN